MRNGKQNKQTKKKKTEQEDIPLCIWRFATVLGGWVYRRALWWLEGDGMTVCSRVEAKDLKGFVRLRTKGEYERDELFENVFFHLLFV